MPAIVIINIAYHDLVCTIWSYGHLASHALVKMIIEVRPVAILMQWVKWRRVLVAASAVEH